MSGKKQQQTVTREADVPGDKNRMDKRLLEPGWAGELSDREVEYIQRELKRSRRLWRKWGYLGALLKGVSIPAATIRRIAKHGLR
jgi:hypothetical protein